MKAATLSFIVCLKTVGFFFFFSLLSSFFLFARAVVHHVFLLCPVSYPLLCDVPYSSSKNIRFEVSDERKSGTTNVVNERCILVLSEANIHLTPLP